MLTPLEVEFINEIKDHKCEDCGEQAEVRHYLDLHGFVYLCNPCHLKRHRSNTPCCDAMKRKG